jgi:hypothetical protein
MKELRMIKIFVFDSETPERDAEIIKEIASTNYVRNSWEVKAKRGKVYFAPISDFGDEEKEAEKIFRLFKKVVGGGKHDRRNRSC